VDHWLAVDQTTPAYSIAWAVVGGSADSAVAERAAGDTGPPVAETATRSIAMWGECPLADSSRKGYRGYRPAVGCPSMPAGNHIASWPRDHKGQRMRDSERGLEGHYPEADCTLARCIPTTAVWAAYAVGSAVGKKNLGGRGPGL
jgi:hypothetical protein